MSADKKKNAGLVPKLRFPEFRGAAGWTMKDLKDTCEVNPANSTLPKQFIYIDLESVEAGNLKVRKTINRDEAPSRAQRLLRQGDVIFQIVRPYQRNNLHFKIDDDIHYVASTGYAQLRANESEDFLFQAIHTDDFVERVIAKCTGSSYPAINSSDLADISIAIPSNEEQQKIADCLTSLDDLITLEAKKLNAIKVHKKGLMQQLFPAEGETLPKLRFPEFREAGEWSIRDLGDISDIKTGPFGSVLHESDYVEIGTPIITVEHLGETEIKGKNAPKVSDIDKERLGSYVLDEGDIVFSRVGSVDRSAIVRKTEKGWLFSGRLLRLRIISTNNSALFLNQLLKYEPSKAQIRNSSVGQTMASLNTAILKSISLPFPSMPEQQKIADCLSSLDTQITVQAEKLKALKTHKKGLMQQLFPTLDGVSA